MFTARRVRCILALFVGLTSAQTLSAQHVVINEFMAANNAAVADPEYHAYADWIELYNPGSTPVDLHGWSITDDLSKHNKFVFAAGLVIAPQGYLIVWADDKGENNHANFKLSASGESIGIFDPAGALVDSVSFGPQHVDISFGRVPDGAVAWSPLSPSSPGAANHASQVFNRLDPPVLSRTSGFFPSGITVAVTHPVADAVLRYTIDGHTPVATSRAYTSAISVDSTTVLRVRAFKDGFVPSATTTATYFLGEPSVLPIFSLVTDPENFFSDTAGIYVEGTNGIPGNCRTTPFNWNQDWERPVDLEFFEADRHPAFQVQAGVKIFGGCSRIYPEKSLAFYFRDEYGLDHLPYQLFPDMPVTEFKDFMLRSSGQDWWRTMFRDGMAQTLIEQGMRLDDQNYRPSVLFINGQYWGIHNLGEKLNEHYIAAHYGMDADAVDLVEISKGIEANAGDLVAYNAMMDFITANSLAAPANYAALAAMIDMDEYIDYTIAQIYAANGDWPGSNMKLWRERTAAGKWRWMVYDLDFTFGGNGQGMYYTNTLEQATAVNGPSWPNPPWSTLMLRKLLENTTFKNEFIQRFAVHMNTTFEKEHVLAVVDSLAQGIAAEIPRHKARWPQSLSLDKQTWQGNVQIMRDFASMRPDTARKHFLKKFGIAGLNTLTIARNTPAYGKVFTHGVECAKNGWAYTFFRNIPLRIKASAMPGCRFVRWQGVITSTAPETTIVLTGNAALTAVFECAGVNGIAAHAAAVPEGCRLLGNYPNPFNPSTTIRFSLPRAEAIVLTVFDMLGREVETLADGRFASGDHDVSWNTQGLPSGVYVYRLRSPQGTESRTMLLSK